MYKNARHILQSMKHMGEESKEKLLIFKCPYLNVPVVKKKKNTVHKTRCCKYFKSKFIKAFHLLLHESSILSKFSPTLCNIITSVKLQVNAQMLVLTSQDLSRWLTVLLMCRCEQTYCLVVRLVAVMASGQVSYSCDREATTLFGIQALLAIIVTQALEQAVDYFLVMADEIGVLTDVVAIPGDEAKKETAWVSVCVSYQYTRQEKKTTTTDDCSAYMSLTLHKWQWAVEKDLFSS